MADPTFDSDGYPSVETIRLIEQWPHTDHIGLLEFVRKCWQWPESITVGNCNEENELRIKFATGGWSGNEEIIDALSRNIMFWSMRWVLSARGGRHEFLYP